MKFRAKEKAKLDARRKLWSILDWHWAYEKGKYTSNEKDGKGYGFFRNNHSLSCTDHALCRLMLIEKKWERKRNRRNNKIEVRRLMQITYNSDELE